MRAEARSPFPIVRRGYDTVHVDEFVDTAVADLARLAGENRELHRRLRVDTGSGSLPDGVSTALTAARSALERMVGAAVADRDRAQAAAARADDELAATRHRAQAAVERARQDAARLIGEARSEAERIVRGAVSERDRLQREIEASRTELDRLVRARVDVHRELQGLSEAVRQWLASTTASAANPFLPPPDRPTPEIPAASRAQRDN